MLIIKPHHFVDIIRSVGNRTLNFTPHPYGHALHTVAQTVLAAPYVELCIELGPDAICSPCCHNRNGACDDTIDTSFRPTAPSSKQAWNLLIDRRWCERLELKQGDCITAFAFCERLLPCVDNIQDIYRELPVDRLRTRQDELAKGVTRFLHDAAQQGRSSM